MNAPIQNKSENNSNSKTPPAKAVEVAKPVASTEVAQAASKPGDTKPEEVTSTQATPKNGKSSKADGSRSGMRVISCVIPEKLARQLRLLCATTGQTSQGIIEAALRKAVSRQLVASIDALKAELGE